MPTSNSATTKRVTPNPPGGFAIIADFLARPPIKARPKAGQPIVTRLAYAAGEEGMYASDLIRFPEILTKYKLDPVECHPGIASSADQLNREETTTVLKYWNGRKLAGKSSKATHVPILRA